MIQFLHDPSASKVDGSIAAVSVGVIGLLMVTSRMWRARKRDINHPETFKREMYAEDDVEEIVVDGHAPIPIRPDSNQGVTPFHVSIIMVMAGLIALGSWFGYRNYSIIRLWDAGDRAMSVHAYSAAEGAYKSAVRADPEVRHSHMLLATALLRESRTDMAVPELKFAAQDNRSDAEVHAMLGDALQVVDDSADAVPEYQLAIDINPNSADYYVRLGSALTKLNRTEDALKEFLFAVHLAPANVKAQANLGCALLLSGKTDEGFSHLKAAVDLAPDDVGARNTYATYLFQAHRYQDAEREMQTEIATNPEFSIGYYNLALTLEAEGESARAIDAYRSYIRKCEKSGPAGIALPNAQKAITRLEKKLKGR